jgi:hypothetical protein
MGTIKRDDEDNDLLADYKEPLNARLYRIERKINIIVETLPDEFKKRIEAIIGGKKRRRSRRGKRPRKSRRSRRH